ITQRIRSVIAVKINEVRFNTGNNPTNQFIELYNASDNPVDISNWNIIHTQSGWASVKLTTIPSGTRIAAHGFYLLGLSTSGLLAPASPGDKTVNVRSIAGLEVGQSVNIDGEECKITAVGTAASPI